MWWHIVITLLSRWAFRNKYNCQITMLQARNCVNYTSRQIKKNFKWKKTSLWNGISFNQFYLWKQIYLFLKVKILYVHHCCNTDFKSIGFEIWCLQNLSFDLFYSIFLSTYKAKQISFLFGNYVFQKPSSNINFGLGGVISSF